MNEQIEIKDSVVCEVIRGRKPEDHVNPKGTFHYEHIRDGKVLSEGDFPNQVTNAGKNSWLGVYFHADAQLTTWFLGLIDNSSYSAIAVADTMASHAGWIENVGYSGGARPSWGPAASASQSITNTSAVVFNITGTYTLQGIFVNSIATLSGTTGTLWTAALFASPVAVNNGDQLKITYTVNS